MLYSKVGIQIIYGQASISIEATLATTRPAWRMGPPSCLALSETTYVQVGIAFELGKGSKILASMVSPLPISY